MRETPADVTLATLAADTFMARFPGMHRAGYSEMKDALDVVLYAFKLTYKTKDPHPAWYNTANRVSHILHTRKLREDVEAMRDVMPPAVHAYVLGMVGQRGVQKPEPHSLESLVKLATAPRPSNRYWSPYKPAKDSGARPLLAEAWSYGYTQEAYADHGFSVCPVKVCRPDWDREAFKRNLSGFLQAARTTTGWAGEGSSWSGTLVETPAGPVVVLESRSSIAD